MDFGLEALLALIKEQYGEQAHRAAVGLTVMTFVVLCLGVICGSVYAVGLFLWHLAELAIEGGLDRRQIATAAILGSVGGGLIIGVWAFYWRIHVGPIFRMTNNAIDRLIEKRREVRALLAEAKETLAEAVAVERATIVAAEKLGHRIEDGRLIPIESPAPQLQADTDKEK
jgi:DNA-binding XRE family transcriptional regulator